jgi:hypothetical protein
VSPAAAASPDTINALLVETWPFVSRAVLNQVSASLEPAVQAAMPAFLPAVIFTRLDLGATPPRVTSIVVRDERADAVVVEMGVEYDGRPWIEMALASSPATTFGIDWARLTGRVEVIVAPLVPRPPLAAAVQASFLDPPVIDYSLTGIAAASDMGPWMGHFRSYVNDALGGLAVLPNRVALKLDPAVDFLRMARLSHPVGVLRVAVLRGYGFPHTDANPIKQSLGQSAEPDVYVVLRLGAAKHTTACVNDCQDPVFDSQVFDFVLPSSSPAQLLHVQAFDSDLGADDDLGFAAAAPAALTRAPTVDLRLRNSPLGAMPRVRLAARTAALSSALADVQAAVVAQRTDGARPPSCSYLLLSVAVDRASNMPLAGPRALPFVRVLLHGKTVMETPSAPPLDGPAGSPQHPRWECSRHIRVERAVGAATRVTFEVRDAASSNDVIGRAFLHLADLLRAPGCAKTYNFALVGAAAPDATLRARVGLQAIVPDGRLLWQQCSAEQQLAGDGPAGVTASSRGGAASMAGAPPLNANGSWMP